MDNILSVVWYKVLPAQFGGQKGIAQFNDYLSGHFKVTCICSVNNQPSGAENYIVKPVLPISKMQVFHLPSWRKILRELNAGNYNHVILEHCYYGLLGIYISKRYGKTLIVHSHNIEYRRFREIGKPWWPLLYWLEKKSHRAAQLNLFKTPSDMAIAISAFKLDPGKCMLVPFGIAKLNPVSAKQRQLARNKICQTHHIMPDTRILIFMGTLDYKPNADAVVKIVREIIPGIRKMTSVPFKVIVCGRLIEKDFLTLYQLKDEDYVYAGFVDDISPYFMGADLFVNPVTSGGGIKVKVIEALSYGMPVVTSIDGANGIDQYTTEEQLIIADPDDCPEFCRQIILSWDKPVRIPEAFATEYDWKNIVDKVADRINHL